MKNLNIKILVILFLSFIIVSSSCNDKEDKTKGNIVVSCVPLEGENVDVSSLTVELHKNADYKTVFKTATATGSATTSSVTFPDIDNGSYYLLAWKDLDNNQDYSSGDYFGFSDIRIIVDGEEVTYTIKVYVAD